MCGGADRQEQRSRGHSSNGYPIFAERKRLNFNRPTTERRLFVGNIAPTALDALTDVGPQGSPRRPKWEGTTLPTTSTVDMGLRRLFQQRVWPGAGALGLDPAVQQLEQARTALQTDPPTEPGERASPWRALRSIARGVLPQPHSATRRAMRALDESERAEKRARVATAAAEKAKLTTHEQRRTNSQTGQTRREEASAKGPSQPPRRPRKRRRRSGGRRQAIGHY